LRRTLVLYIFFKTDNYILTSWILL